MFLRIQKPKEHLLKSTITLVAIEIEAFSLRVRAHLIQLTKPFLKQYHFPPAMTLYFPVFFLVWLLLLGSQHPFFYQTVNDESFRPWPFLPHGLFKGDVIMALSTGKPLLKRLIILHSKLWDQMSQGSNILNF